MEEGSLALAVVNEMNTGLSVMEDHLSGIESVCKMVNTAFRATFNVIWVDKLTLGVNAFAQNIESLEYNLNDVNKSLEGTGENAEKLSKADNKIAGLFKAAAGYISKIDVSGILNASDEFVQTQAKLNMMNDELMSTEQLTKKIYASAKDARGSFSGMTDFVSEMGMNAGESFENTDEIIAFGNLLQKQMVMAGASTSEASSMMSQLANSAKDGVLGGSELNSIFSEIPNVVQTVADYMNKPVEEITKMASAGEITTSDLKNAMFESADEIKAKFSEMPMTWEQVWQSMQDTATNKFQPVLQQISGAMNSAPFQALIGGVTIALGMAASIVASIFDLLGTVAGFVYDNWSVISPVIYGVIAALGLYTLAVGVHSAAQVFDSICKKIAEIQEYAHAKALLASSVAKGAETASTQAATGAQATFNTTLLASPVTWVTLGIIAIVTALVMFANWIAKTTEGVSSGFGVICGWINVGIQGFVNLALTVANIALAIWTLLEVCADNIKIAFGNAILSVQSWFYNLLSTALYTVAGIAEALNKLPFVEIDYSGISTKAEEYAAKAKEAEEKKGEFIDPVSKMEEALNTFDTFQDGWQDKAFAEGAAWGDEKWGQFTDWTNSFGEDGFDMPEFSPDAYHQDQTVLENNTGQIADNTADIKDSVDISNENLKYLRDIAEREAVNRFTTAQIKVAMTNHNSINSNLDLDGVVNHLVNGVNEAMLQSAEGVNSY